MHINAHVLTRLLEELTMQVKRLPHLTICRHQQSGPRCCRRCLDYIPVNFTMTSEKRLLHTEGLRDSKVRSRSHGRGATQKEFQAWSTRTVANTDRTCKLNAITVGESSALLFVVQLEENTYKSPGVMLCTAMKGFCTSTISSMPPFAW